jgi:histidinol-phosphatase (PHP family)
MSTLLNFLTSHLNIGLMWSNFHMHSNFCDGAADPVDYVEQAKSLSVTSLGFSSHAPVPFGCRWCMKGERFDDYLATIESLKKKNDSLEIYTGLEIDYIPEIVSPADFKSRLDFTIGSIHFIDRSSDQVPWEIDGTHKVFLDGLASIFKNDIRAAITRYFELTREMVQKSSPDVVGHLDKIKIQNPEYKFYRESESWYQQEINKTLDVIAEAGSIIEVNTRGIYQKKTVETYPSPWILEKIYQLNIPITLSSDAHHPKDIVNHFDQTAAMLHSMGFKKITIIRNGRWSPVKLSPDGITW